MTAEKLLELAREHARLYRYAREWEIDARPGFQHEYYTAMAEGKWALLMSLLNTTPTDE